MINNIYFNEQILTIDSSQGIKRIDLGQKIEEILLFADRIFVRFEPEGLYGTEFYNRNIVCLDENGAQLWRVEDPDWYRSGKEKTENPFVWMSSSERGVLRGATWDCFHMDIDVSTGKLGKDWDYHK